MVRANSYGFPQRSAFTRKDSEHREESQVGLNVLTYHFARIFCATQCAIHPTAIYVYVTSRDSELLLLLLLVARPMFLRYGIFSGICAISCVLHELYNAGLESARCVYNTYNNTSCLCASPVVFYFAVILYSIYALCFLLLPNGCCACTPGYPILSHPILSRSGTPCNLCLFLLLFFYFYFFFLPLPYFDRDAKGQSYIIHAGRR